MTAAQRRALMAMLRTILRVPLVRALLPLTAALFDDVDAYAAQEPRKDTRDGHA